MMPSSSATMTWRAGDVGCAHADWTMQQRRPAGDNERQARHGGPDLLSVPAAVRVSPESGVDLELLHCARFPPNFRRATC